MKSMSDFRRDKEEGTQMSERVFPQANIVTVRGEKEELFWNAEAVQTQMHNSKFKDYHKPIQGWWCLILFFVIHLHIRGKSFSRP